MNKLLTVAEVMKRLGKSGACGRSWVCRELNSGRLKGEKVGSVWIVTESALEKYLANDDYNNEKARRYFGRVDRKPKKATAKKAEQEDG